MFLGRLRIRGRLAVLITIPLLAVAGLSIVIAVGQVGRADAAATTVRSVNTASQVGSFIAELQHERLVSIGYLIGVEGVTDVDLARQNTEVADRLADLRSNLGDGVPAGLREAIDATGSLGTTRNSVAQDQASPTDVVNAYDQAIVRIIDAMQLADGVDTSSTAGREVLALDALLRIDELNTLAATELLIAAHDPSQAAIVAYAGTQQAVTALTGRFESFASPAQIELYGLVKGAYAERTGPGFARDFNAAPKVTVAMMSTDALYPQFTSYVALGRFVETKIAADVTAAVSSQQRRDLTLAYFTIGIAILIALVVAALSVLVARSVVRSLSQLTSSANRTARIAEAELERVADEESEMPEPVHLDPLDITAEDEFGDVARAFQRVQHTAAALVERQVASRRNVAQMFGHVGRRTQNLVGRQLALIDSLEYDETDPRRLEHLYRLDHVASRLRRNAGSLVVLSGATDQGAYYAPMPLADIVRLALGEIEDYTRVDIFMPASTAVQPAVINDLVLMLAELMENATTFSPPHTRVSVSAAAHDGSIVIVDEGIGMSPERLDAENARLAQRERLDLAPTEVLGLFVVGRLARRHGMSVALSQTPGGGTTVVVDLGPHVVATPRTTVAARAIGRVAETDIIRPRNAFEPLEPERPQPVPSWPQPAAIAVRPFNVETLERATKVLEAGPRWNAFEVLPSRYSDLTPALAAAPAAPPADREPETEYPLTGSGVEGRRIADGQGNGHGTPAGRGNVVPEYGAPEPSPVRGAAGGSALTRRVPGATTLHDTPVVQVRQPRPMDPGEARDMVEQFQMGVAQALRDVGPDHDEEDTP